MLRILTLVAIILTAQVAHAAGWGRVKFYQITGPSQFFFFQLENISNNHPACAASQRFVVNLGTPQGQAIASAVLTAAAQGKSITAYGNATCALWADAEDVNWVEAQFQYP